LSVNLFKPQELGNAVPAAQHAPNLGQPVAPAGLWHVSLLRPLYLCCLLSYCNMLYVTCWYIVVTARSPVLWLLLHTPLAVTPLPLQACVTEQHIFQNFKSTSTDPGLCCCAVLCFLETQSNFCVDAYTNTPCDTVRPVHATSSNCGAQVLKLYCTQATAAALQIPNAPLG
jgi:hypothetical protein